MGFPTKVRLISRKTSEQCHVNFPSARAVPRRTPTRQLVNILRGEVWGRGLVNVGADGAFPGRPPLRLLAAVRYHEI